MSGQGESLSSETPDTLRIPLNNKRKKTPYTLIIRKQPLQEPFNPRKMAKGNTLTDVETISPSVNDFFEKKQIIEDLETELTGLLSKIG